MVVDSLSRIGAASIILAAFGYYVIFVSVCGCFGCNKLHGNSCWSQLIIILSYICEEEKRISLFYLLMIIDERLSRRDDSIS